MKNPGPPSQGADRWAGSESKSNDLRLLSRGTVPGPGTDNLLGQMLDTTQLPEEQLAQRICNGMAHSGYCALDLGRGQIGASGFHSRSFLTAWLPEDHGFGTTHVQFRPPPPHPTQTHSGHRCCHQCTQPLGQSPFLHLPRPLGQELPHCDGEGVLHS